MGLPIDEFVKKYNGVKVDYDKVFGPQCVDLFRQWADEGLDIPEHTGSCSTSGGAKDLFLDYSKMPIEKKYFYRYSKTSKGLIPGDILIWDSTEKNSFGHVAIFLATLNNSFIVFEQDGFKKDGAKVNLRSKEKYLGFLRRK